MTENILIIIFGILIFLSLVAVAFVNRILTRKERIDFLFESVMKYVEERIVIFERMSSFVEETVEEEMNYVNKLNDSKDVLHEIIDTKTYNLKEIIKSEKLLKKFPELLNTYPNLSKNEIFNMLSNEVDTNINRIEYAIASYNEKAKEYNEFKKSKLNAFICKLFKLNDYEYYEK